MAFASHRSNSYWGMPIALPLPLVIGRLVLQSSPISLAIRASPWNCVAKCINMCPPPPPSQPTGSSRTAIPLETLEAITPFKYTLFYFIPELALEFLGP